jgi:Tat protein secretion system quality control protein TatD with DNase activity
VLEVVSALTGHSEEEIAEMAWKNTLKMFNIQE